MHNTACSGSVAGHRPRRRRHRLSRRARLGRGQAQVAHNLLKLGNMPRQELALRAITAFYKDRNLCCAESSRDKAWQDEL